MKKTTSSLFLLSSFALPFTTAAHEGHADGIHHESNVVILRDYAEQVNPNAAAAWVGASNTQEVLAALGLAIIAIALVYLASIAWERYHADSQPRTITPEASHRHRVRFVTGGTLVMAGIFILAGEQAVASFLALAVIILLGWHALHTHLGWLITPTTDVDDTRH